MSNALATITDAVAGPKALENLRLALGSNTDLEEAKRFASGILNEIRRSAGQEYGDLTTCSPDSIVQAMLDSARFKIPVDGRRLAHLEVRYNKARKCNEANLMIDTNGLVYQVAKHYPDLQISDVAVFENDEFEISEIDGIADFKFKSADPFKGVDKLKGIAVKLSFTDNGRRVQTVEVVSKADLLSMQAKAKGTAWKDFPIERMRTAAIKRSCKWVFRKISGVQEVIDYDNAQNYDLSKAAKNSENIVDNLNKQIAPPKPETIQIELTTSPVDKVPETVEDRRFTPSEETDEVVEE